MQELDDHYPTVDTAFLCSIIEKSSKVIDIIKVGRTTAYILDGQKPVSKRTITVRASDDGQIDYYFATGIAIKLGLMSTLLAWFETHRNWKDGAYVER